MTNTTNNANTTNWVIAEVVAKANDIRTYCVIQPASNNHLPKAICLTNGRFIVSVPAGHNGNYGGSRVARLSYNDAITMRDMVASQSALAAEVVPFDELQRRVASVRTSVKSIAVKSA